MENNKITPTTIITGFLGAGKTTYLNSVLQNYPKKKFAIIENEFGEKNIDSNLIIRGEEDVIEINNGCLCCTLNEGLYDILSDLYTKRNDFDELIIEATGVADPRGLALPFFSSKAIKKQFPLRQVICLIDAVLIEAQLQETEEAIHQITFSDILLINKTDLIAASAIDQLKTILSQLNPLAKIFIGNEKHIPDIHHESSRFQEHTNFDSANEVDTAQTEISTPHDHKHTKGITSISLSYEEPFDLNKFRHRLNVYLMLQSKGLYRMKGIIWFKDSDDQYLLQSVGKHLSIAPLDKWNATDTRKSTIVMIGIGLKKSGLDKLFSQCR